MDIEVGCLVLLSVALMGEGDTSRIAYPYTTMLINIQHSALQELAWGSARNIKNHDFRSL